MDRRAVNFCTDEIELLLSLVEEFKDIVECKKSDVVLWRDKEAAWANIAQKLAESGFPLRTTKQLRDKWSNLKKETKKKYGDEKLENFKTGGGPKKIIKITPIDDRIKLIMGVAVTGDSNMFDSDKIRGTGPGTDSQVNSQEDSLTCDQDKNEESNEAIPRAILHDTNWSSWNPSSLKAPKAPELTKTQELKGQLISPGPIWTPKRALLSNKFLLNEHKIKEKFIVIKNPKLMGNKEHLKPQTLTRLETVAKPEIATKPETFVNLESSQESIPCTETVNKTPIKKVAVAAPSGSSSLGVRTPSISISGMKKKTALTADCRLKINVLSEAKLELTNIQKDCLLREMINEDREHELKMNNEREEHEIKMKKHKIELELLELELKNKSIAAQLGSQQTPYTPLPGNQRNNNSSLLF